MTGSAAPLAAQEAEFDRIADPEGLHRRIRWVIEQLLRRDEDCALLGQTRAAIDQFFTMQSTTGVPDLRRFCKQVLALTVAKRPSRAQDLVQATAAAEEPAEDDEPAATARPPRASLHGGFPELLAAALVFRIRHVTTFFHRRNPRIRCGTLPPFLLSPAFDERFETVVAEHIAPAMLKVPRFVAAFEHGRRWNGVSTADFWAIVTEAKAMEDRLLATWRGVWNEMKPSRSKDGRLVAPQSLVQVRKVLAPGEPPAYVLPRLGDDVINLLARLLSDLRGPMEQNWAVLTQICEQEVVRRPEVAVAAVADRIPALPGRLGEFVAILCRYNIAGVDCAFLRQVAAASIGTIYLEQFLANGED